jgi:hypothetical protein
LAAAIFVGIADGTNRNRGSEYVRPLGDEIPHADAASGLADEIHAFTIDRKLASERINQIDDHLSEGRQLVRRRLAPQLVRGA